MKATLRGLATVADLDRRNVEGLRELYRRVPGVHDAPIRGGMFRRVVLHRNNACYGFVLDVCEIIHRNLLTDPRTGETTFRDFTRDDKQMANLFERFLLGFYGHHAPYRVHAPQLSWRAVGEASDLAFVPVMRTDIVLESVDRIIVMDAKYYAEMLAGRFSAGGIRSGHLYQLFAYMSHIALGRTPDRISGVLLYPQVEERQRVAFTLSGHKVLAATVNLQQPQTGIHAELLGLLPLVE